MMAVAKAGRRGLPRLLRLAVGVLALGAAALAQAAGLPRYLLVHMDAAMPGKRAAVEATRQEYRGWVAALGPDLREVEVHFLAVGDDELWALRPADSWNRLAENAASDSAVESGVRAAVGAAFDDNERRMHGNIVGHHNELLRLRLPADPAAAGLPGDTTTLLQQAQWVVRLSARPDADSGAAVEAALAAWPGSNPGGWMLETVSSPGSGARFLFIGGRTKVPKPSAAGFGPPRAIADIRISAARLRPELAPVPKP